MASASTAFRRLLVSRSRFLTPIRVGVASKGFSTSKAALGHGTKGFAYRTAHAEPTGWYSYVPDIVVGTMWWWILWNVFTEPGHIIGEFPDIVPSNFTDEELGIPPDDEN